LLSYARAGAQGKPLEPTDCAPIVRELLADAQDEMRRVGAEAVVDELPVVLGDAGQLRQVFQNLIGNALKFRGEEPPRIRVSCERREDWWQICVRDNGIGIDPRYRERIFEMFKRLHSRDKYPGTGIGLAICKKIVERHGGRIWVEPAPGEGAVFCFTLRAADGGK
ncbi:MAG TPA: ATP-binding protein, partial [Elusimicrobiota bacterium]|nr:ATP-binding protein [Elusimicrobiota bacterium]